MISICSFEYRFHELQVQREWHTWQSSHHTRQKCNKHIWDGDCSVAWPIQSSSICETLDMSWSRLARVNLRESPLRLGPGIMRGRQNVWESVGSAHIYQKGEGWYAAQKLLERHRTRRSQAICYIKWISRKLLFQCTRIEGTEQYVAYGMNHV